VAGCSEDGAERLAVVAAVKANKTETVLLHADADLFGQIVANFAVARVAPPEEYVGRVQELVGKALVGFVESNGVNF
jgi:hypothetical protein